MVDEWWWTRALAMALIQWYPPVYESGCPNNG
jgi:hypothetical protein